MIVALLLAACGVVGPSCDLDDVLRRYAGEDARDCGLVGVGDPQQPARDCTVEAFEAGEAFFGGWDTQGIDSTVTTAFASDGETVWTVSRDSAPCGGPGCAASIDVRECVSPRVETDDDGFAYVGCDWQAMGDSDRVCP